MQHSLEVYAERMEKRLIRNGRNTGRKEKALEIAKKMKAKGKNVNEIAEFTDLTVDAILRL